jgi:lipoprotein-anchoring transpeptidase ErfK/SrfK
MIAAPPALPLRPGARGALVLAMQRRLSQLGYWLGTPDGYYADLTVQAVTALQKAAGLPRDGVLGPRTRAALAAGVVPTARTASGRSIEINLARQLLLVVDGGRVTRILNVSTGSGAYYTAPDGHRAHATTPTGTFSVRWAVDGWDTSPLGHLYRPRYFHPRGIAVHGYPSVPSHPASHGCVRVSEPAMDMIWTQNLMPRGGTVRVY